MLGWTGGFVLVSILVGPYLRKFGAYTVPDFLAFRYGGNFARFLAVIVLVCCSFTYVTAQIYGTGLIASRFLGMRLHDCVSLPVLAGILLCSMLGGMRAVTWTQIAQYIVLDRCLPHAHRDPVHQELRHSVSAAHLRTGTQEITAREQEMLRTGLATAAAAQAGHDRAAFFNYTPLNFFGIILCMMVGTASLPHILMRYFTTPSVREARQSVAWSLFFIFSALLLGAGLCGVLKAGSLQQRHRQRHSPVSPVDVHLGRAWSHSDLRQGRRESRSGYRCLPGHRRASRRVRLQDFVINTDVIVLSTPEIAGLPYVISGLVAAGGLAAALSTADGLLLAIANALSHDIYYKMLDTNAPTGRRL